MKTEINYIAEDGRVFKDKNECYNYEKALQREHRDKVHTAMIELDMKIWKKYYPDSKEDIAPQPHLTSTWLTTDIAYILSDNNINTDKAKDEIIKIIKESEYHEEILKKYISMDSIIKEATIKKDFHTSLKAVKEGSDLAHDIRYLLSTKDLKQLAELHKSNKCRKKIESLLTCCNFHYECSKFINKEYAEFLEEKEV